MKRKIARKILLVAGVIFFLIFCFLTIVFFTVSNFNPPEGILAGNSPAGSAIKWHENISLLSWNLGYAGLGEESNFLADGGKSILPPSRQIVAKNISNITRFLQNETVDIYILQEVAKQSRLIFNLDLWKSIKEVLPGSYRLHSPTVKIPWLPLIGRLETGNAVFSNLPFKLAYRYNLPLEEKGLLGTFQQKYNFILLRYKLQDSSKELVVLNLHLAAFDEGGNVRKKQLSKLKNVILEEYGKGNFVIAGGDWNHRLIKTDFPYTAPEKFQFWIHDLPQDFTPSGWQWALDTTVPTVRTLERAYHPSENYTCIIDGFLLSPNVELKSVQTFDLQFKSTDHHPVKIEVSLKGKENERN